MRLFVALPIPEAIKSAVLAAQNELRACATLKAARFTRVSNMHVTLAFLGEVEGTRVDDLSTALAEATTRTSAFRLRAEKLGVFPNARAPRVLWAGLLDTTSRFVDLFRRVADASAPFSRDGPGRHDAFAPHLTLARFDRLRPRAAQDLARGIADYETICFGEWSADHVELVRSHLGKEGAAHETIATFALATE